METVEHSLIRMLREGPEVSLKGSPTVSPMTAALWQSEPLPPWVPLSMYFLGVVPGAAGVGHEHGHHEAGDGDAAQQAHHGLCAQDQAGDHGTTMASREGTTISCRAPLVQRSTQEA